MKSIPIAFVVSSESNEEKAKEEIYSYCREMLPDQSVPKAIYFVENIPINTIGKPDYQFLESEAACLYQQKQ